MLVRNSINIPSVTLDGMILEFGKRRHTKDAVCEMGVFRREGRQEILHHSTTYITDDKELVRYLRKVSRAGRFPLIVSYGVSRLNDGESQRYASAVDEAGISCAGLLHLYRAKGMLMAEGWLREGERFEPVDMLKTPGPGMGALSVGPLWPLQNMEAGPENTPKADEKYHDNPQEVADLSRLILRLGEGDMARGQAIHNRTENLRVAQVGCGRMGSKVLIELAKSGVARRGGKFLIDADLVEEANRDVMLLPESSVGKPKAEELAKLALALDPGALVIPIVGTISDRIAAEAAMSSDIIINCTDNDAAVVGTEVLARRCNRVHFALTGGTAYTKSGAVAVGGDMRLSLCGCKRCTICFGDVDWRGAMKELSRTAEQEKNERLNNDWMKERPGSDGGVLCSVTGGFMHTFWRLLQGKQRRSLWMHYDANGEVPGWHDWTTRARRYCRFCGRNGIGGLGDWKKNNEWRL